MEQRDVERVRFYVCPCPAKFADGGIETGLGVTLWPGPCASVNEGGLCPVMILRGREEKYLVQHPEPVTCPGNQVYALRKVEE